MIAASDSQRPLTERGHAANISTARQLLKKGVAIEKAFCSPYLRAQQTAADMGSVHSDLEFEQCSLLTPDTDCQQLLSFLERQLLTATNSLAPAPVLLVGHNPLLSRLTNYLLDTVGGLDRNLDTSNLVCLNTEVLATACAQLDYWLSPEL